MPTAPQSARRMVTLAVALRELKGIQSGGFTQFSREPGQVKPLAPAIQRLEESIAKYGPERRTEVVGYASGV